MDNKGSPLKVLVTGAAGFLGSNLVDFLLDHGHTVIGLDNLQNGSSQVLDHLKDHPRFEFIKIYGFFTQALQNLGAKTEVYGNPSVHPQPEYYWGNVNPFGPRACYDEGKRAAEALCYAYREQHGVDIRIARIFNTYGPRMGPSDGRVVSSFITSALKGNDLKITGDGTTTRSFQYVTDCIKGLYTLMQSDYSQGPVNIGNDGEFTIQQLAELVIELVSQMTGRSKVAIVYSLPLVDDPMMRRPDISLAREVLCWEPVVQLEEGLRRTIEWHINQGRCD
ncbi:hypothetical protein N7457_007838 [Penicillium paradoxum]|uniref:uncharacterized protein n=1 Tax=Penicillium paradoxum TaxID=176176 RepID=UPI002548F9F9|nr:uncharacterized protein N7457_007838 [Penicillium paradoxum]KAJ5772942.1 hypothetical protein N7457_007838 [Penicillium paradoxum]